METLSCILCVCVFTHVCTHVHIFYMGKMKHFSQTIIINFKISLIQIDSSFPLHIFILYFIKDVALWRCEGSPHEGSLHIHKEPFSFVTIEHFWINCGHWSLIKMTESQLHLLPFLSGRLHQILLFVNILMMSITAKRQRIKIWFLPINFTKQLKFSPMHQHPFRGFYEIYGNVNYNWFLLLKKLKGFNDSWQWTVHRGCFISLFCL